MRGNNQRKFFILVISRALVCLQHSPSQFPSLEVEPHPCSLCTATITFFFFSFTFKQLITKPSQRCSSSFSKNQFLSELPFVWPHSGILPLDSALISLPGSCAADTPVSSGIVISLARGLAAAQKARLGKGRWKCLQGLVTMSLLCWGLSGVCWGTQRRTFRF